jgi:hypothetical protein
MELAPEMLRPGHRQKMQEWSSDLDLAKGRADRSKEGVKIEEDIREGESNRKYKDAQGEYYKELPKIRSEQTAATKATKMVMITPEIAKELGYDDERIGEEITATQYTADKKQKGFRDHDASKMTELEKKLAAKDKEIADVTKRLKDIEEGRNQTRKDVAKTTADARIKAAGISGAAKPKAVKNLPKGVKRGDKTYVAYMDSEGNTTVTDYELGSSSGNDYISKLFQAPETKSGAAAPKPAATANSGTPEKKIRIKIKSSGQTGTIKESEFDSKFHERL